MSAAQKLLTHPAYIQAQSKAKGYVQYVDKELTKYPALITLEERTQIPKTYAFLGGVVLVFLLHLANPLAAPVSNLIGWALPAFLSFRALETPSVHDDIQWLSYWTVFGFLNMIESLALRVILHYISWYFALKTVFVLWLQLPAFRGAQTTYHAVLKPLLGNLINANAVAPTTTTTNTGAAGHD